MDWGLGLLGGGALEVEGKQPFQDFSIGEVRRPTVSGVDGGIEFLVGELEPGRTLVVEVSEGALFQFRGW